MLDPAHRGTRYNPLHERSCPRPCTASQPATRPRRGWFRYSLRTFLLVVTLCAAWLGWQVHVVRERAALREWLEFRDALVMDHREDCRLDTGDIPHWNEIPWYRRPFGDRPAAWIVLHSNVSPQLAASVRAHFPEARVDQFHQVFPLTDAEYAALKAQISEAQLALTEARWQLQGGSKDLKSELTDLLTQSPSAGETFRDRLGAISAQLQAEAIDQFSSRRLDMSTAIEWLRAAQRLRLLSDPSGADPQLASKAQAAHVMCAELLNAKDQVSWPDSARLRNYHELLVEYEIVSCQDQPESASPLSPAERRWHAAGLLGERLCEAAHLAATEGQIGMFELASCWERRRDARLGAAGLTNDGAARRQAWDQFADTVRKAETDTPLQDGIRSHDSDYAFAFVPEVCLAAAGVALAEMNHDEVALAARMAEAVECSDRLLAGAKIGGNYGLYTDAVRRWMEIRRQANRLGPAIASLTESSGKPLAYAPFVIVHFGDDSLNTYLAAEHLLLQLDPAFKPPSPAPAAP